MTDAVAVVAPVLGRPDRVAPLIESLEQASCDVGTTLLFVVSAADDAERAEIERAGGTYLLADWTPGRGDWARKINLAVRETGEPWVFTGADDLRFHAGWADRALETAARTGAGVIGTNDLGNPAVVRGLHSTHSLVSRRYAELGAIDDPSRLLCERYAHNFVDNELVQTAISRGEFAACPEAVVEHLHPSWRKATPDATYEKGQREFGRDRALFQARSRLWTRPRFKR